MALLTDEPRSATIFATRESELLFFGRREFMTLLDKYPRFLADVNGDGRADIIGFGDAGVWEAPATGNRTFAAPLTVC